MADVVNTLQFLNKEGLLKFKALMTSYIDTQDAASIKGVGLSADGKKMLFYKEEPISGKTAAYEIELPETDLSDYMHLAKTAVAGNLAIFDENGQVTDAGKKLADFATAAQGALAESAVQSVTTGTANGMISVDGVDVPVFGLGTAAYKNVADFDAAGAADAVLGTASDDATKNTVYGAKAAAKAASDAASAAQADVDELNGKVGTIPEGKTVVQMIADAQDAATYDDTAVKRDIAANAAAIEAEAERAKGVEGELSNLATTAKTNLVGAINEVKGDVAAATTASAITIDTGTTTAGYLKTYTIKQGETTIGAIDIPKDMVVESGEVVTNPDGKEAGTYIKLVLANVAEPLYINVGTLVDIYKAKASATQVQVTVDSTTREISAVIVAGSIGTTELADDAVTTAKIADANVTKAKLASDVQVSLGKADTAVQSIETGATKGTIAVDGTDVAVNGLGSAAYTESSAYDVAGAAAEVLGSTDDAATKNTVYGAKAAAAAAQTAADNAQAAADAAQSDVDSLTDYVGTFTPVGNETTVVGYIDAKAKAATYDDTALKARVAQNEADIAAINDEATGILKKAKDYADTQDTATLASAKGYADTQDAATLESAKTYADEKVKALTDGAVATNTANIAQNANDIADLRADVDAISAIPIADIEAMFA